MVRSRRAAAKHSFATLKRKTQGEMIRIPNLKGTGIELALPTLADNLFRAIKIKAAVA
jgi:hypothetical protein